MDKIHLMVNGIENAQSKTSLQNALDVIEGVSMVNIDLERGSVEVGFSEPAEERDIKLCIENTGHAIANAHYTNPD